MKFKNLAVKFCVLLIFVSVASLAEAQKKKVVRKPVNAEITDNGSVSTPEIRDFAFVVDIDKNVNVTVRVQNSESSNFLADSSTRQPLTDFFTAFSSLQNKKNSNNPKEPLSPITIINADKSLYLSDVVGVIQALRVSSSQKIKLKISENLSIFIPKKIENEENYILKPNPNTLIVFLTKNYKIRLNQDEMGDITNMLPLKETLKKIFNQRADNGILREGTTEVERTVFIKAPLSLKFIELIDLIKTVAETGASPIGLQVDDLEQ